MRVLVTGAKGFVGAHLVPRLEAEGFEVLAADRELDVTDAAALEGALARFSPDAVVHLAAVSSVPDASRRPERAYRVNFLGARNLLAAIARGAPAARILLVGSATAYGSGPPGAPPFPESAPLRPTSPYALTKAAAELLGAAWADRGLDVVRVRAFNHTGPGQTEDFALSSFAKQAAEIAEGRREPRLRVGNLESTRDFLDVRDVVEAYLRLLDRRVPCGTYNVASGSGSRLRDLLGRLLEIAGIAPEIEVDPARLRPTDAATGDATRLREATGWRPRIPIEETLEGLVTFWRRQIGVS